ncbi:MAG TPA: TfoX/Sxy family protein [Cyclobacteriaceae bacterium]
MAYNEQLSNRVRESLTQVSDVEEKKMFRGITFMVNGKMCVSVGDNELMCRINPELMSDVLEKDGVRPMIHGGKTMKGFIFVDGDVIQGKKKLDYWISLALDYNKNAKSAVKRKRK